MLNIKYDSDTINKKRSRVKEIFLENSSNIKDCNIKKINIKNLQLLFSIYDKLFLNNYFKENYIGMLKFTLSHQMTKSAGITRTPINIAKLSKDKYQFEIKISLDFLFNYYETSDEKSVNGIVTNNPLDVLLLVFEHEICHIIEFIFFFKSSCGGKRFKLLAKNIFSHTDNHHKLTTLPELNYIKYGIKVGDMVSFSLNNINKTGIIYRMNKRAIVMVEDKKGKYYNENKVRFSKYFIPLPLCVKS